MEIQQLRYFVAAAEHGNFTRAAQQCAVAQPSLSQQIIKLEQEIGMALFDRVGRRVLLTDAGRALLLYARDVLSSVSNTERSMKEMKNGNHQSLTVGMIPTISPYLLPKVLPPFIVRNPATHLAFTEDYTNKLIQGLSEGRIDVVIAALPIDDPQVHCRVLGRDPLLLCLPKGHVLRELDQIEVSSLEKEPFIVLEDLHCLGDQVVSFCRQQGFTPRVSCRMAQLSTVQLLVGLGLGISLVPAMAATADTSNVRDYCQLAGENPERTIVAIYHKQRTLTGAAREFLDVAGSLFETPSSIGDHLADSRTLGGDEFSLLGLHQPPPL